MRLFIAIELEGEARDFVLGMRQKMVESITRQGVRFVKPEKLHLTIAFLGDVDEDELGPLAVALGTVNGSAFEIAFQAIGGFPDLRRPKVVWIGLNRGEPELEKLSEAVKPIVKLFAPQMDDKPFSAHLTVARVSPGSKEVGAILSRLPETGESPPMVVDHISLVHSKRDGTYETIAKIGLR